MRVARASRRGIIRVSLLLLAGCAAAQSPGDRPVVSRVFIDIRRSDSGVAFSAQLRSSLVTQLDRCGVHCQADEQDREDPGDGGKKMREYYPDLVITLVQADTSGIAALATFTLAVFRPNSAAPLWSALLSPEGDGWGPGNAERIANETIARLEGEGLIGSPDRSR